MKSEIFRTVETRDVFHGIRGQRIEGKMDVDFGGHE